MLSNFSTEMWSTFAIKNYATKQNSKKTENTQTKLLNRNVIKTYLQHTLRVSYQIIELSKAFHMPLETRKDSQSKTLIHFSVYGHVLLWNVWYWRNIHDILLKWLSSVYIFCWGRNTAANKWKYHECDLRHKHKLLSYTGKHSLIIF